MNNPELNITEKRIRTLRSCLTQRQNDGQILNDLGNAYLEKSDIGRALSFLCQAVAADGKKANSYASLGRALLRAERHLEAICAFRQALALDKNLAEGYEGLGLALSANGELDLAISSLRAATAKLPSNSEFWANLAHLLIKKHKYEEAYVSATRACKNSNCYNSKYVCLPEALFGLGKFEAALRWLRKGIRMNPKWHDGYHNIGRGLYAEGRYKTAKSYFRKAISLFPDHAEAHFGLATSLLGDGDFTEGWKEYEWRFRTVSTMKSSACTFISELTEPMWNGEEIAGKTLLVYAEQGFGDIFQSVRYVPELAKKGAQIILMVYPELVELFRPMVSEGAIFAYNQLLPRYDYHIPLFSVPRLLKTTLETIPSTVPYIPVPAPLKLPKLLKKHAKLRIGFVWSSRRTNAFDFRSVPIGNFEPLFQMKGAAFFSFQVDEKVNALDKYKDKYTNVHSLKHFIKNWHDTACFVGKMDLLISIDTGFAHLAGGLGKPVWLILSRGGDWRYLSKKQRGEWATKSPWYPTMRLYRASSLGSWEYVINQIRRDLLDMIASQKSSTYQPVK